MFSVSSTLRLPAWAQRPQPNGRRSWLLPTRTHISFLALTIALLFLTHLSLTRLYAPSPLPPPILTPRLPAYEGCAPTSAELLPRENACILVLVREADLPSLLPTLRNFEHRFNARFRYPYVFISSPDEPPFSPHFRSSIREAVHPGAVLEWGQVPEEEWKIPEWLDEEEVRKGFERQEREGVLYGGREGYHHMCRWYSGLFATHELVRKYEWFWRLEPGVRFFCSVTYDPFRFLAQRNQTYGFTITLVDAANTLPTLWPTVEQYVHDNGLEPNAEMWDFLTRPKNGGTGFNRCHFWTNFEIGHLPFIRSEPYQRLFSALDRAGGFYTERWGDAPVRTIALALLLGGSGEGQAGKGGEMGEGGKGGVGGLERVHWFEDLGYRHAEFLHCPTAGEGSGCDCDCPPYDDTKNIDIDSQSWGSCVPEWRDVSSLEWKERHSSPASGVGVGAGQGGASAGR